MTILTPVRTLCVALAGLGAAGCAVAQGFTSVSSQPATQGATTTATVPAATAPAAASFTSVSSVRPDGSFPTTGAGPQLPSATAGGSAGVPVAERIVIEKRARRLMLLAGGEVVAVYPVKLGLNPTGHKQYEGDFRTPEGSYFLSRRNPRSEYFLSLEVSYPNDADRMRAKQAGMRPGGLIMIHGQPNVRTRKPDYYANTDWTNGCIAVSNSDMIDIWQRTRVGMPIEIRP